MKRAILVFFACLCAIAVAAPPVITNIRASQRPGTKLVDIFYDLADEDGNSQLVAVAASADGGVTYSLPVATLSGHVGANVSPGTNRKITWDAGADWGGNWVPLCRVRVTAFDGTTPPAPPGMALIPAGPFQMGDNLDGMSASRPLRNVHIDNFFMDKHEVSWFLWQNVWAWGNGNGYEIYAGGGKAENHPAYLMNWYEAVKWCNARSQKDGLTPCYYTNTAQTIIYKAGNVDITNAMVKWNANGYRLPTEAEWEKAARGGATGLRYPWGNEITVANANYGIEGNAWVTGEPPYTSPVGSYPANGYGLFDMAGNVFEWTWDWYDGGYYGATANLANPYGPVSGTVRMSRGGSWGYDTYDCRVASRIAYFGYGSRFTQVGFRAVRR